MLLCNWSNQIDVLYRALSDADYHLHPLLLFVLVDITCVSEVFISSFSVLYFNYFYTLLFFLRGRIIWGLKAYALVIQGFSFLFYSDSVSVHDCLIYCGTAQFQETSVIAALCNCHTECNL